MDERTALAVTRGARGRDRRSRARASGPTPIARGRAAPRRKSSARLRRPQAFVGRRAQLALERLARAQAPRRARSRARGGGGRGSAPRSSSLAFVLGARVDAIGGAQRINILAPPVALLVCGTSPCTRSSPRGFVVRYGERERAGPCARAVAWLAGGVAARGAAATPRPMHALAAFAARLDARAPRRSTRRAPRASCTSPPRRSRWASSPACTCAASGSSTARRGRARSSSRRRVRALRRGRSTRRARSSPASPVPDVAQVAAIRAPASENAARWLHLMAATLAVVVVAAARRCSRSSRGWSSAIAPRTCCDDLERSVLPRLLRGFRAGPVAVRRRPVQLHAARRPRALRCRRSLARALGGTRDASTVAPPVAYGDEDALPRSVQRDAGSAGRAVQRDGDARARGARPLPRGARAQPGGARPLVVVVDEAALARALGRRRRAARGAARAVARARGRTPARRGGVRAISRQPRRAPRREARARQRRCQPRRRPMSRRRHAVADLAHQRGQDDARAHAARRATSARCATRRT